MTEWLKDAWFHFKAFTLLGSAFSMEHDIQVVIPHREDQGQLMWHRLGSLSDYPLHFCDAEMLNNLCEGQWRADRESGKTVVYFSRLSDATAYKLMGSPYDRS